MTNSGFYENPDALDSKEINLLCYGMVRSGSTLVWQLLNHLFSDGVIKTHSRCHHLVKTTVTIRDFRDATVSHWRAHNLPRGQRRLMTMREIKEASQVIIANAACIESYWDRPDICVLRYEDFAHNPKEIFHRVKSVLDLHARKRDIRHWIREHSLAENQKIADRLQTFENFDPVTHIHGNHIHDGRVATWRGFVDRDGSELLNELLQPIMGKYYGRARQATDHDSHRSRCQFV